MKTRKIILLSLILLMIVCTRPVSASAQWMPIPKKATLLYCKNEPEMNIWSVTYESFNGASDVFITLGKWELSPATYNDAVYTLSDAKTSNKKVVKIKAGKYPNEPEGLVAFTTKGPGKATVSFKYNDKIDKKSKVYKIDLTVKEVKNSPIKSLKIGKKDVTKKIKKGIFTDGAMGCSGKIDVKVNSGWKLMSIRDYTFDKNWNPKIYTRKNGKILPKDKERLKLIFTFQHTKTKVKAAYSIINRM